jgi:hypothetical protein
VVDGFFRGRGVGLADRVFELARFWRLSPREIEGLSLREFDLWEAQAIRINELEKEASNG